MVGTEPCYSNALRGRRLFPPSPVLFRVTLCARPVAGGDGVGLGSEEDAPADVPAVGQGTQRRPGVHRCACRGVRPIDPARSRRGDARQRRPARIRVRGHRQEALLLRPRETQGDWCRDRAGRWPSTATSSPRTVILGPTLTNTTGARRVPVSGTRVLVWCHGQTTNWSSEHIPRFSGPPRCRHTTGTVKWPRVGDHRMTSLSSATRRAFDADRSRVVRSIAGRLRW